MSELNYEVETQWENDHHDVYIWLNYLGFDKKGYSYELTKKEYYYLEAAHQHMSLEDVKKFGVSFNKASKVFKDFIKGRELNAIYWSRQTVTDGFKTYVLTSEFDYKFVSYGNHAQHHVSPEVLKMLVGEED